MAGGQAGFRGEDGRIRGGDGRIRGGEGRWVGAMGSAIVALARLHEAEQHHAPVLVNKGVVPGAIAAQKCDVGVVGKWTVRFGKLPLDGVQGIAVGVAQIERSTVV